MPKSGHLADDFTTHDKYSDLGRWYINQFVASVGTLVRNGSRVLDLGAGECVYRRFFSHASYCGVDAAIGESTWEYSNLSVLAFADALPFSSGSFDDILCTQLLEHVRDPRLVLTEARRVLRPGGRLFLTVPMAQGEHQVPYDFYRYTSFGLRHLLESAGFASVDIQPFGGRLVRWAYEAPLLMHHFPGTGLGLRRPNPRGIALLPIRLAAYGVMRIVQRLFVYFDRFDEKRDDPFGWSVIAS